MFFNKRSLKLILFLLIFSFSSIQGISFTIFSSSFSFTSNVKTSNSGSDNPIIINNKQDFDMYSSSGDGSKFNPYLIEYKTISICSKNQIGVLINGTSQFFILQNITVVQCKSNVDLDTAGFYLFNVSNGLIRNCNGTLLHYSFELNNSSYNTLTNNYANSSLIGFKLYFSIGNTISDNTAINDYYGILLDFYSSKTLIEGNYLSNVVQGISLESSPSNTVKNNIVIDGTYGIFIAYNGYSLLEFNTVKNNENEGFIIFQTTNNSFVDNLVSNNGIGFSLKSSSNNSFIGNTVTYNKQDFSADASSRNNLFENNKTTPSNLINLLFIAIVIIFTTIVIVINAIYPEVFRAKLGIYLEQN